MNRQQLIEGLLKEGFTTGTLSILNDKQLHTLYKKMVTETNVVIHDPAKLKDIEQQIDPEKDTIEVRETEQELSEIDIDDSLGGTHNGSKWCVKHDGGKSWIVVDGKKVAPAAGDKHSNIVKAQQLIDKKSLKESQGWESKAVAKTHKDLKSGHGKLKAAQTKMDDKWSSLNFKEKEEKRKEEKKKRKEVKESNIGKFHKPVFKNEEELAEKAENKVGCDCGKCDICNKDKTKKKPIGLSEQNCLSLAKKGDIMQMIQKKLVESSDPMIAPTKPQTRPTTKPDVKPRPKTPFRPAPGPNTAPKAEMEKKYLPDFLSFNTIFGGKLGDAPTIAPTKPKTDPRTKPSVKPRPKTPFRPAPGPNTAPKAERDMKKDIKEYLDMNDVEQIQGTPYGKIKEKKVEDKKKPSSGNKTKVEPKKKDVKK
jgi:hypothetical protein